MYKACRYEFVLDNVLCNDVLVNDVFFFQVIKNASCLTWEISAVANGCCGALCWCGTYYLDQSHSYDICNEKNREQNNIDCARLNTSELHTFEMSLN